jgi:hypothetical protein
MANAAERASRAVGDAASITGAAASSVATTAGAIARDPGKYARQVESSAKRAILLTAIPDDGSPVTRYVRGFTYENPNDMWNYVARGVTASIKRRVTGEQPGFIDRVLADRVDAAVADVALKVSRTASESVAAARAHLAEALARTMPSELLPTRGDVGLRIVNAVIGREVAKAGVPEGPARREAYRGIKREMPDLQFTRRYSPEFKEWSASDDAIKSGIGNIKRKLSPPRPSDPMKVPARPPKSIRDQRAALDRANAYRITGYAEGKRAAALAFREATAQRRQYLLGWWRVSPSGTHHWVHAPRRP